MATLQTLRVSKIVLIDALYPTLFSIILASHMGSSKAKCSNQSSIFSTCEIVHRCYNTNMWNCKVEKNLYLILAHSKESFPKSMLKSACFRSVKFHAAFNPVWYYGSTPQPWSSRGVVLPGAYLQTQSKKLFFLLSLGQQWAFETGRTTKGRHYLPSELSGLFSS